MSRSGWNSPPYCSTSSSARNDLSTYYLASEIASMWRSMMVMLPERFWHEKVVQLTPVELARCLTDVAADADVPEVALVVWTTVWVLLGRGDWRPARPIPRVSRGR